MEGERGQGAKGARRGGSSSKGGGLLAPPADAAGEPRACRAPPRHEGPFVNQLEKGLAGDAGQPMIIQWSVPPVRRQKNCEAQGRPHRCT